MRVIVTPALFLTVLTVASSARAEFQWLEDWSGQGAGRITASVSWAGHPDPFHPAPPYPPDSISSATRRFEITNAPTGGLPMTLTASWNAVLDYLPRTQSFATASASISGGNDTKISFAASLTPGAYGYGQGFSDLRIRDLHLKDGIYTLAVSAEAGLRFGPGADFAGSSYSHLDISLTPAAVPEPSSAALLLLGSLVAGTAVVGKRRATRNGT